MHRLHKRFISSTLATVLLATLLVASPSYAARSSSGFNDEYVFAATRGVNDMDGVHPALKVPLFPVTLVLDVAALPFAVIAGFIG
jgi:hypothetical protein